MGRVLLPPVDEHLLITVAATGARLHSRVDDDVAAHCLLVHEPLRADGSPVAALPAGSRLALGWTSQLGQHELDATLVEVRRARVTLWQLATDGATRTRQLRRYARAADTLLARLRTDEATRPTVVVDLGEGGARITVPASCELAAGERVELQVTVDGSALHLPARVVEVLPLDLLHRAARLEFEDIGRAADVLRRRVLEQQRRARAVRA